MFIVVFCCVVLDDLLNEVLCEYFVSLLVVRLFV